MIEVVDPYGNTVVLIVNEEGVLDGIPLNRKINEYTVIAGTFFVCESKKSELVGLSREHLEQYKKKFEIPEFVILFWDRVIAIPTTPAEYDRVMKKQKKGQQIKIQKNRLER